MKNKIFINYSLLTNEIVISERAKTKMDEFHGKEPFLRS
jgi:hypothetical protein